MLLLCQQQRRYTVTEAQRIQQEIIYLQDKFTLPQSNIMKMRLQSHIDGLKRALALIENATPLEHLYEDQSVSSAASVARLKRAYESRKSTRHFFSANFMIDLATVTCIEYRADALLITQTGLAQRLTVKLDWETSNRLLNAFKTFKGYAHA